MNYCIEQDAAGMGARAAEIIVDQIRRKPDSVLGLATGSTPVPAYRSLVERHRAGEVDFSRVRTFNLDEYLGLPADHPQSFRYFMEEHLFRHINLPREQIGFFSGTANDPAAEADRVESAITTAGGIDLLLLGIGGNGHIGFCEPADTFSKSIGVVSLTEETIQANARFFRDASEVPRQAISMGIGTFMQAEHIVLIASGSAKSGIIRKALLGDITPKIPASVLQLHRQVSVVLDSEAAGAL